MPGSGRRERSTPSYDLNTVKAAFARGNYKIGTEDSSKRIWSYLSDQGWDEDDVTAVVANLKPTDFRKSMEHDQHPGIWLDVYKPVYEGERVYLKFHVMKNGVIYVVKSFWNDGPPL